MLYNNPLAYRTDFLPAQIAELAAEHPNLQAVKESSGDVRRVTALRALCGDRLALLVGVDDVIVEGVRAGAVGWIGGLVNALPRESVALFACCDARRDEQADALYRWFLPLLRMDTVVEVRAAHQARAAGGRHGQRARARPAPRARRRGARGRARDDQGRARRAAEAVMRIRLLGTGTPTPSLKRMSSGYLVETGERKVLFDFGPGAYHRMLEAGVRPVEITDVFFTHLHYDHCLDYMRLLMTRWDQGAGRIPELNVYGPAHTARMTELVIGENGMFGPTSRRARSCP